MKKCLQTANLYFYLTGEMDAKNSEEFAQHLLHCPACQNEKEQLTFLLAEYTSNLPEEPDEATLRALRNVVSLKLKTQNLSRQGWTSGLRLQPWIVPLQYVSATLILVAFGFFLGRMGFAGKPDNEQMMQHLLTGEQQIQAQQSDVVPYLAGIDKIKYDPTTGQVEMNYSTVNDVYYRGNTQSAIVRQVLRQAMLEQTSPSIHLQAVKAMTAIAEQDRSLDAGWLEALEYLLREGQNPGVRLMALRVFKLVPLNETMKQMLLKIIVHDKNTALRIQAFETLTGKETPKAELKTYLQAVKDDTSSYIRYKADELLKKLENEPDKNKTYEISREE